MFKLLYTKYSYVSDPLHQSDELLHLLIALQVGLRPLNLEAASTVRPGD